jgi:predicted dehydrogenase
LKGTWKDEPLPAGGQTYDLGAHLIDQALTLFGRPEKLTAFIQNVRGVGRPEVDDCVSRILLITPLGCLNSSFFKFTIHFHYPAGNNRPHPFTAILRAHILSARSPQLRFVVRGTRGTFIKYGLDLQEDQLKAMSTPKVIFEEHYGKEPESIWGTVETLATDNVTISRSR